MSVRNLNFHWTKCSDLLPDSGNPVVVYLQELGIYIIGERNWQYPEMYWGYGSIYKINLEKHYWADFEKLPDLKFRFYLLSDDVDLNSNLLRDLLLCVGRYTEWRSLVEGELDPDELVIKIGKNDEYRVCSLRPQLSLIKPSAWLSKKIVDDSANEFIYEETSEPVREFEDFFLRFEPFEANTCE